MTDKCQNSRTRLEYLSMKHWLNILKVPLILQLCFGAFGMIPAIAYCSWSRDTKGFETISWKLVTKQPATFLSGQLKEPKWFPSLNELSFRVSRPMVGRVLKPLHFWAGPGFSYGVLSRRTHQHWQISFFTRQQELLGEFVALVENIGSAEIAGLASK